MNDRASMTARKPQGKSWMNTVFAEARRSSKPADRLFRSALLASVILLAPGLSAQPLTKAAVGDKIRKVEDGVDQFRKYLDQRGENARSATAAPQAQGRRRTATESQKSTANAKKDELDDALGDLNRSTNRLRRKFEPTDKWQETRAEVERVLDDGRRINQAIARGNYGSEAARLWAALRNNINDLARAYGLTPLGV
jgi:hypothetical protein